MKSQNDSVFDIFHIVNFPMLVINADLIDIFVEFAEPDFLSAAQFAEGHLH